jgi:23S rRNA (adenine2503-C2)-methyltransferase
MKRELKNFTLRELEAELGKLGEQPYHAAQIFRWVYQRLVFDFSQMSDLSQGLREKLKQHFLLNQIALAKKLLSSDGTRKYLFVLPDQEAIETVLIPAEKRNTLCLSSQVGCRYGCKFCASGLGGFKRDLATWEILAQILKVKQDIAPQVLSHIVFMGMGEPLDNYDNVIKAIKIINHPNALGIGRRRITLSTCGLIPQIARLIKEDLEIELSLSLHSASNEKRKQLLPINQRYPLEELKKICLAYTKKTKRLITFEYLLIKGFNHSPGDAAALLKFIRGLDCKINLIAYNPVGEFSWQAPEKKDILAFENFLRQHKVKVTLRVSKGEDIQAACGQLRLGFKDSKNGK